MSSPRVMGRFGIIPAKAFSIGLAIPEIATLAALSTFADEDGWCHPSLETLARMLDCSTARVSQVITALVEKRVILRVRRRDRGQQLLNNYRILYDAFLKDPPGEAVDDELPLDPVKEPVKEPVKPAKANSTREHTREHSEADASGDDASSAVQAYWAEVGQVGSRLKVTPAKQFRGLAGRYLKLHDGDAEEAVRAIRLAAEKIDPVEYLAACVSRIKADIKRRQDQEVTVGPGVRARIVGRDAAGMPIYDFG